MNIKYYEEKKTITKDELYKMVRNTVLYELLSKDGVNEIELSLLDIDNRTIVCLSSNIIDNVVFEAQMNVSNNDNNEFYGAEIKILSGCSFVKELARLYIDNVEGVTSIVDVANNFKNSVLDIINASECYACGMIKKNIDMDNGICEKCKQRICK